MDAAETISEPTYPNPPKWWWTKRIFIIAIVLLLGLGIVWKWWQRQAHQRLETEIAAIRALGEPLDVADFEVAPVPDEGNAVLLILSAISTIPSGENNFVSNLPSRMERAPLTAADRQGLERVAKASTTMRSLVRTARFQPQVQWSTNVLKSRPALVNQTQLPRFLHANALQEHLSGHDAEAIEIARDMLFLIDSLEKPTPSLLMHLIAMVDGAISFDTLAQITPDLQVLPVGSATTQPAGPASREQVQALIAALLDDQDMQQGLARGFQIERAAYLAAISPANIARTRAASPSMMHTSLAQPWVELGFLRAIQELDKLIATAEAPDLHAAQLALAKLWQIPERQSHLTMTILSPYAGMIPKIESRVEGHLHTLALRRIAAIQLATRLYQVDHDGQFPARLEELLPNYLSTMPADPFASGAKPFNYSKSPQPMIALAGRSVPLMKSPPATPASTRAGSGS